MREEAACEAVSKRKISISGTASSDTEDTFNDAAFP